MELSVKDVSKLLNVPEKTVYRWIQADDLPAHRVEDQYFFNRTELLEWITGRSIEVPAALVRDAAEGAVDLPGLADALEAGGIHHGVPGASREQVLRAVVDRLALPETVDRDFLFGVLLAREQMGSTAVGDGIALPHVRNPIVLHVARPAINLCLLERPVDFQALDGAPVRALFTVISPTHSGHLHLLSRIAFALRDPGFKAAVQAQLPPADLVAHARRIDELIAQRKVKRP
jgi:PTS system nitrogen regulatory IIA component